VTGAKQHARERRLSRVRALLALLCLVAGWGCAQRQPMRGGCPVGQKFSNGDCGPWPEDPLLLGMPADDARAGPERSRFPSVRLLDGALELPDAGW
jgi:hypothetical protein